MKKTFALLIAAFALTACGSREEPVFSAHPDKSAYVILPANYIVDVAGGSNVILNPAAQEFALFPGKQAAFKALAAREDLDGEEWRVYRLEGNIDELGKPCGEKGVCLATAAKIADWEQN